MLAAAPAVAQDVPEVLLDASPQVFSVLCALRAADAASFSGAADPVAARVEEALRRTPAEAVAPLRDYLRAKESGRERVDASPYLSLALLLGPPPEFPFNLPENQLPPDAYALRDFVPLLQGFYKQAGIETLWRQVRPHYERAILARQGEISNSLLHTRSYVRLLAGQYPGRSYVVYLEWLSPPGLTSARNYGEHYYLIIHPERKDLIEAVRHQYLHFLLDPILVKYAESVGPMGRLQNVASRVPRLAPAFKNDMLLLATESLIQAVELRLQRLQPAPLATQLDERERSGYLFIRHFYQALQRFEEEAPSIQFYFPELMDGYDAAQELERLAKLDFLPASARPAREEAAHVAPDAVASWLAEAEQHLAAGNFAAARERFTQILERQPHNPGALYGSALVASAEHDAEQARQYFQLTVEHARDPLLLAWSHIYLGRIYDLEGERQRALEHYQAALALNTRLDRVEQAARRGLEQPFGAPAESPPRP